jgi:hypothetical protein
MEGDTQTHKDKCVCYSGAGGVMYATRRVSGESSKCRCRDDDERPVTAVSHSLPSPLRMGNCVCVCDCVGACADVHVCEYIVFVWFADLNAM